MSMGRGRSALTDDKVNAIMEKITAALGEEGFKVR